MPATRTSADESPRSRRVLLALVLLGAALRMWQWAADGSLWLDEIALSRNIHALSLGELPTHRLAFDQVAPPGFLAAVKLSTPAFGDGERALWLFPLLCGPAGLLLFRRLAERTLQGVAAPLAVALFAIGLAPIRYSAEVKQYGVDASVAAGLTLLAFDLRARDRSIAGLLLAGAAGLLVIWFSQTSAIVMAGLGDPFRTRVTVFLIPSVLLAAAAAAGWLARLAGPALRIANDTTRRYLGTMGRLRDSLVIRSAVSDPVILELYDLSDPARLRSTSAETFPAPPMPKYPKPGCRDWSADPRAGLVQRAL